MTDENKIPPPPDMSKLVPDGWEQVTTGGPKLGDAVLWRREWQCLSVIGGHLWEYQMVIRKLPPQKKVRPLNAEEWRDVAGCIRINGETLLPLTWSSERANWHMANRMTCHPPGFPDDVRKLWVEE